ncbi:MAG: endonuclease/exonuclease/phosphatase family protein, partial [Burkholderiaceae bacterium]
MRIVSLNLNGIRSAASKGALAWLGHLQADVVCVQELKAQEQDLSDEHCRILHNGRTLQAVFYCAQKKGYSGVGIYSARAPTRILRGIG